MDLQQVFGKGVKNAIAGGYDRISGWISKLRSDCPELRLLVIGETAVGKSTLINNLLGEEVAGEGHNVESTTSAVRCYIGEIEGVPVKVYDTPGLGDSREERDAEYLKEIRKLIKTETIHLVIYCLKMSETRMRRSIIRTFEQYTKIGVDWKKTVIALTFADNLKPPPKLKRQKGYTDSTYFRERLSVWRVEIPKTLASEIKHKEVDVTRIKINPTTGDYKEPLPNGEDWYLPFWLDVMDILPPAARIRFVDIHKNNIIYGDRETREEPESPDDFELPPPPTPEDSQAHRETRDMPQGLGNFFVPSMPELEEPHINKKTRQVSQGPGAFTIPPMLKPEEQSPPLYKPSMQPNAPSVGEAVNTAAGMAVGGMTAGSLATIGAVAAGAAIAPVALPVAALGALGAGVAKLFGWW